MTKFSFLLIALSLSFVTSLAQSPEGNKFRPPLTAEQLRIFTGLNKPIPNKEFEARMRASSSQSNTEAGPNDVSVTIVNTASQLPCGQTVADRCTNGMFLTFYIGPNATSVTGTFNYLWPTVLSDEFKIRYESCRAYPNNSVDMGILGVFQFPGYQQVNAYVPGDEVITKGEPYGVCNLIDGTVTGPKFNVLSAPGSPFRIAYGSNNYFKDVELDKATPAIFSANGSGTSGAPAGFHLKYVNGVEVYTTLATCNADPSQCPVTTNGVSNSLVLYSTGGENIQCSPTTITCGAVYEKPGISLKKMGSPTVNLTPIFIGEVYLG